MSKVTRNIVANMAGTIWGTLVGLVVVPVYLKFIGAEGYGLIGFYTVLSTLLSILDSGFSAAAARELARSDGSDAAGRMREMVYVLERLFLGASLAMGVIVFLLAPQITTHWLNVQSLSGESVIYAVRVMGGMLVLQFPLALYNGCLLGMQRHARLNGINSAASTIRAGGGALVLWLVSATVEAFFLWQMIVTCANLLAARSSVWRLLPPHEGPLQMRLDSVRRISSFAMRMGAINMLGLIQVNLDKATLSFIPPLNQFGYYVLAWTLASVTYRLSGPVYAAMLPRMTELEARGERTFSESLFEKGGQLMAVLIIPFSLFMATFAEQIVFLWTRDAQAAAELRWVVALLTVGTMISGILQVPLAIQVATGKLRPIFLLNVCGALLMVPLLLFLTSWVGIIGAGGAWLALNIVVFVAMIGISQARMGTQHLIRWSVHAIALPVGLSLMCFVPLKVAGAPIPIEPVRAVGTLFAIGALCELLVIVALPFPRGRLIGMLRALRDRLARS